MQQAYDEYISVRKELGRTKPICLMDIATLAAKYLKKQGKLDKLDESEEIKRLHRKDRRERGRRKRAVAALVQERDA